MRARLELRRGFDELEAELKALAPVLAGEARPIQKSMTESAAEAVRSAYKVVTGALREGVRVVTVESADPYRVQMRVESTAPHAPLYEFGTARSRAMPTFVPITVRARRAFKAAIVALVRAQGLDVTGDKGQ